MNLFKNILGYNHIGHFLLILIYVLAVNVLSQCNGLFYHYITHMVECSKSSLYNKSYIIILYMIFDLLNIFLNFI